MNVKFLRFDLTPGEKHIGIATVRLEDGVRILLRFKIVPRTEGGYYFQPAAHKININGKDNYFASFQLDSSYESEELKSFLGSSIEKILKEKTTSEKVDSNTQYNQMQKGYEKLQKREYFDQNFGY